MGVFNIRGGGSIFGGGDYRGFADDAGFWASGNSATCMVGFEGQATQAWVLSVCVCVDVRYGSFLAPFGNCTRSIRPYTTTAVQERAYYRGLSMQFAAERGERHRQPCTDVG